MQHGCSCWKHKDGWGGKGSRFSGQVHGGPEACTQTLRKAVEVRHTDFKAQSISKKQR